MSLLWPIRWPGSERTPPYHLARQHSLHREVALKTARQDRGASAAALLREAVIAGSLEHPGIVPVHALGVDSSGAPVLVMKRVEGVEWRALVTDEDHPAWAHRPGDRLTAHVEILIQVCQAVHFAHSRQVVHRDRKELDLGGRVAHLARFR